MGKLVRGDHRVGTTRRQQQRNVEKRHAGRPAPTNTLIAIAGLANEDTRRAAKFTVEAGNALPCSVDNACSMCPLGRGHALFDKHIWLDALKSIALRACNRGRRW